MRVVVTGADGFLGWHLRCRLRALTDHAVVAVGRAEMPKLTELVRDADAVIHLAGVNRAASDEEVERGNVELARSVAAAIEVGRETPVVSFANSIQAGNGTPYGRGKQAAAELLAAAVDRRRGTFVDISLPNLFGEHARPRYNSFVATFTNAVLADEPPSVQDRPVELLHAQAAAQSFIDALSCTNNATLRPAGTDTNVSAVLDTIRSFHACYATGDVPPLQSQLDVDLFNTLRAAMFPDRYPIGLVKHADARGELVECVRSHGGQGQTFVSTSHPGITRGEHFHLGKIERFVVVKGRAQIALRRLLYDDVATFEVSGDRPCIVDMPTMWAHNITNIGADELVTVFWAHPVFDPHEPDTYPEPVEPTVTGAGR